MVVIPHPCPTVNGGLTKPSLTLCNRLVTISFRQNAYTYLSNELLASERIGNCKLSVKQGVDILWYDKSFWHHIMDVAFYIIVFCVDNILS